MLVLVLIFFKCYFDLDSAVDVSLFKPTDCNLLGVFYINQINKNILDILKTGMPREITITFLKQQ